MLMKVMGGRGDSALYIGYMYVFMPTDCMNSANIEGSYKRLYSALKKGGEVMPGFINLEIDGVGTFGGIHVMLVVKGFLESMH